MHRTHQAPPVAESCNNRHVRIYLLTPVFLAFWWGSEANTLDTKAAVKDVFSSLHSPLCVLGALVGQRVHTQNIKAAVKDMLSSLHSPQCSWHSEALLSTPHIRPHMMPSPPEFR